MTFYQPQRDIDLLLFLAVYHTKTKSTMAVPPKFAGQLATLNGAEAKHTIELYLDYVCPFSAKMFKTIQTSVRPLIEKNYSAPGVRLIFRQQIQPWREYT